jgi:hypothetical protein
LNGTTKATPKRFSRTEALQIPTLAGYALFESGIVLFDINFIMLTRIIASVLAYVEKEEVFQVESCGMQHLP